jgi:hypothetical protein
MTCISSSPHTVASTDNEGPSMFFKEIISRNCGSMAVVSVDLPMSEWVFLIKSTVVFEVDVDCHLVDSFGLLDFIVLDGWLVSSKV